MREHTGGEHVVAQLAACRGAVGVAVCPGFAVLELRGVCQDVVRLACALTDGCQGWWELVAPHRAIVLLDANAPVGASVLTGLPGRAPDVAVRDRSRACVTVAAVGPRAGELLAVARPKGTLLAATDGGDRLVVVPTEQAAQACAVLLAAGRELGAIAVGAEAIRLHRAARHVQMRGRASRGSHPPAAMSPTGEPIT